MTTRVYQLSLRTIFEATFVVAVLLGFLYWRTVPRAAPPAAAAPPPGRYELRLIGEDAERMIIFDTATGECRRRYSDGSWYHMSEPLLPPKADEPAKR